MGKTKGKAPVKAVPPMVVSTPVVSGAGTSTSSSASANSYQNLIRSLFSIPEGPSEERTEILKKLAAEYKFLASSNKLNVMKDRYLTEEVQEIQLKYNSASADYNKAKEEHDAQNSKYIKLKQLSQQLSDRTKQLDAKAAAALYEEQQKRVKLTESFSGSIASISSKLDSLTTRKELVVTENIRLKAVLKSYLEEFDADQKAQEVQAGDSTTPPVQGAADESPPALDPPISTETQETTSPTEEGDVSVAASSLVAAEDSASKTKADSVEDVVETPAASVDPAVVAALEAAAQAERAAEAANQEQMALAEDVTRLAQLRATEQDLRAKTAKYSALFDSFQSKLAACNTGFQSKQASIEALSKEMVVLEKENSAVGKRVSDCIMSTKVIMNMHSNIMAETQKQVKVVERYSALMELLQKEIDDTAK